ncbi:hypothetical protein [Lacisediminihabitans profunda]|uniref:DUF4199 domain-containing protein n=1 Tax=Lacisediminihabitans profunda TaxID=2594790 RepID=A0A5C8UPG5_9MICO|nr:hypothetical protein [Lacisediminihabitans profunda]TXN30331.1 hypothetical protein FVP33_09955 [Lacisediminihabitans profunda]
MTTPALPESTQPAVLENVVRGTIFALLAVPVGVILWVVIWNLGVVSAIVAFVVAAAAAWLYRKGSGGRVSFTGALVISGVVLATLLLSFYFGLVSDWVRAVVEQTRLNPIQALTDPGFWPSFNSVFGELLKSELPSLGLALLFGLLGAFTVLRRAFASARAQSTPVPLEPLFPRPEPPRADPEG